MTTYHLTGLALVALLAAAPALAADAPPGHDQDVGQTFHVTADAMPEPYATPSINSQPKRVTRTDHEPIAPPGFEVKLFAENLPAPRRLIVGFDGVIYVAAQFEGGILALYDKDGDGAADQAGGVLQEANNPFGMDFEITGKYHGDLILGDGDAIYRLPIDAGGPPVMLSAPGALGKLAGHISREVAVDPKNGDIYVGVGSTANLDEGEDPVNATIQRFDLDGKQTTFAKGMRNTTGIAIQPGTGDVYATVMERDSMGDELVPDYLSRIQQDDDFGWPYQYIGGHVQPDFKNHAPKVAASKMPDVLFAAHSAPLDLVFVPDTWPEKYRGGALVALHGSTNALDPRGYKVVFVPFKDGRPDGTYENFLTGFWVSGQSPAEVWGRPCSLTFDRDGSLLVGDDLGNTIWRVSPDED